MKVKTYKFSRKLPSFHKPNCTRNAILSLQLIDGEMEEPSLQITVNRFNWKSFGWNNDLDLNPEHFGNCLAMCRHVPEDAKKFLEKMFKHYIHVRSPINLDISELPPCSHAYKLEKVPYHVRRQIAEECKDAIRLEIEDLVRISSGLPSGESPLNEAQALEEVMNIIRGD